MPKISDIVKENKLFDSKTFNKLSPKEQDCVTEIFETVENGNDDVFIFTRFEDAIETCCKKYGVQRQQIDNFIDNQTNDILGEIV